MRRKSRRCEQRQITLWRSHVTREYAMPVDLPPKPDGIGIAPASSVLDRILNWTAIVVCIGLGWWAAAHLL
jgi:hypothetical protein